MMIIIIFYDLYYYSLSKQTAMLASFAREEDLCNSDDCSFVGWKWRMIYCQSKRNLFAARTMWFIKKKCINNKSSQ